MNKLITKTNILDTAIAAFHHETGLQLKIIEQAVRNADKSMDAVIEIPATDSRLLVEVKKWAAQANLGAVINQIKDLAEPGQGLLVADYINPNMGQRLKEAHVQFLDTAGNAYINQPAVFVLIKGNKPQQPGMKVKTGRAFQPTGMKIVFAFLTTRELINAPYRKIAEHTGVALGTVGWVIRDLLAEGFLLEGIKKNHRKLADFDRLLDKWVEAYPHQLKAKHKLGVFTTTNHDWWKTINLDEFNALWAGEIAAAKYTNYLTPKHAVVYIDKADMTKFLKTARLRKTEVNEEPDIHIELIEPFWKVTDKQETKAGAGLAHPIIIYADLIASGDPRNLDTANRLREKYIRQC